MAMQPAAVAADTAVEPHRGQDEQVPARDPRRTGLRRAELRQHAAGHGQDEQAPARDPRRAGPRRAELRQHAAGHGQDEQAPLPEIPDVPDFDAQSFVNTLRDMAETSKLLPELFDSLRRRRGGGAALVAASTLRRSKSGRVVLAGAARGHCTHPYKLPLH